MTQDEKLLPLAYNSVSLTRTSMLTQLFLVGVKNSTHASRRRCRKWAEK